MAFTASNLRNINGDPSGDASYVYDAGSDDLAAVALAGYFNNTDDLQNLAADDRIWCQCADGNMTLRVSAVSSGSVTCQFAGGDLPINTPATNSDADATLSETLVVGQYEIGTAIATATRYVLPTPYPGARMRFVKSDSGSELFTVDAGGSGATAVYFGAGVHRRIQLQTENDMFEVVGSSTSRWRVVNLHYTASLVSGGSVFMGGT